MMRAVICSNCGAKVRADRGRCPRCREVFVKVDPKAVAASSRRLQKAAAGLVAVFLVGLGILWLRRDAAPTPTPARQVAGNSLARTRPPAPAPAKAVEAEAERPFLDSAGSATVAYGTGDYASALAGYQAAVERNPQDAESWSNLGQVLVRLNRVPEAIPAFERAISILPDRWAYRFNLARALGLSGRWNEAIASYRRAQELFPDDYATTFNLALALHSKGDEASAVREYEKAITLSPQDASFRKALAISLERLGKPAEAAAAFNDYLTLAPTAPDAEKVRARIAQLSGGTVPSTPLQSSSGGAGSALR